MCWNKILTTSAKSNNLIKSIISKTNKSPNPYNQSIRLQLIQSNINLISYDTLSFEFDLFFSELRHLDFETLNFLLEFFLSVARGVLDFLWMPFSTYTFPGPPNLGPSRLMPTRPLDAEFRHSALVPPGSAQMWFFTNCSWCWSICISKLGMP